MENAKNLWNETLENLKPKVSEVNYNNWLKQLEFLGIENGKIRLGAPNSFVKDWVVDYYNDIIIQELYSLSKTTYALDFEITGEKAAEPVLEPEKIEQPSPLEAKPRSVEAKSVPSLINNTNGTTFSLNKKYTFDKFVVGSANQFAHAAAASAAELPGAHYNPLFIYGGVGLGKTHLLNAVGLGILERFPESKIIYQSAEQFMNELIFCIRFEKMDAFRKKYRDGCDVLLVDDIQFMIGKERTQEEFFHTFNTLYESQRQIVVTSDKLPKDLDGLEERLRSRFEWGLIADIQAPDLETRIAILKKKADQSGITLEDDVALFLASQIKSNVRELEGSLIRLSAFASLTGTTITVELAKEVLKNIIRERAASYSIESIQRAVSDYYHVKPSDLKSPRRLKSISKPRQIAMFLCKKHLEASYPEIGHKFGGKDHSTVIHAVKKIEALLNSDSVLKNDINLIEKTLL